MGSCHSKLTGRKQKEEPIDTTTKVDATNGASKEVVQPSNPQTELRSERLNLDLAEDPNYQRKLDIIDYSMEVIDLFGKLSDLAALVFPDALGMALKTITAILERLKKMIENKQAWKDLLTSIDERQRMFNEQVAGVKERDFPPSLLSAMKRYAQTLEKLAAKVMEQAGVSLNLSSTDGRIAKIKAFMIRAKNADSDVEDMNGYKAEMDGAISELETALALYTAVTVNRIDKKADNLKALIFLEGINTAERNPLGTKHTPCLKDTRIDILADIRRWKETEDAEEKPVYCIGDMAGTGKSTIAYTMAKEWSTNQCFSFFFSNTSGDRAQTLCISFAKQIIGGCYGDDWDDYWAKLSSELSSPVSQEAENLWEKLVSQPLAKCTEHKDHVIVVDALDECDAKTRITLLKCLLKTCSSETQPRLRLLFTTRKDNDIGAIFAQDTYSEAILLKSLSDSSTNEADIAKYVEHRMSKWKDEDFDPTAEQIGEFVARCGGLFIFASLACGLLEDESSMDRSRRLQDILVEFTSLDTLYRQTLLLAEGASVYTRERLRSILGAILVAREPLSISSIAALLSQTPRNVRTLIKKLGSVLGSGNDDEPVYILHATLKEFLLRENLVGSNQDPSTGRSMEIKNEYYTQEPQAHLAMLNGCLSIMSKELKFNICRLETSFLLNDEVGDLETRIRSYISSALLYSCLYWTRHLELAVPDAGLMKELRMFMETSFLFWLEVLSVTKSVASASGMLRELTDWMKIHNKEDIMAVEMGKFVTTFASVIAQSTPHIYLSALPFTPSISPVSKHYSKLFPRTMKISRGGFGDWPLAQNVLFGHTRPVASISLSPNGRYIASGSWDKTIRIWDVETGEAVKPPFKGHEGNVMSVAFSPNGRRIASASLDSTVRVWDVETGEAVGAPFTGHGFFVTCVAFAPDGKTVASGSMDQTIRVWDAETGEAVGAPFTGHDEPVNSIMFSPDSKRLVSGSGDIRIWDVETGEVVGAPLKGHNSAVTSAAFSPDGKMIASGSVDKTIRVWDAETGEAVGAPFEGHENMVKSVAFSPDGKRIISGSEDKTIRVWDVEAGKAVGAPLKGHDKPVNSVAFSPDGKMIVSGSDDNRIRVWDVEESTVVRAPLQGHDSEYVHVAFSPDGKRLVTGAFYGNIRLWDLEKCEAIGGPFKGHNGTVSSVAFSPNSKRVVSGSSNGAIWVWDVERGEAVAGPFEGPDDTVTCIVFSPDGKRIMSGSGSQDQAIRVWDAETGEAIGAPFKGHTEMISSIALSPDGKRLVSGSIDKTIRIWDVETGQVVGGPFEHESLVTSVAISPDGERIASGGDDKMVRVWDVETGQVVGMPFNGHDGVINNIIFSPDGKKIISGSDDKTVRVWDVETGQAVGAPFIIPEIPYNYGKMVTSVVVSEDGKGIFSVSQDGTNCVWEIKGGELPSFRFGSLIENGWMMNPSSERLYWVPPHLHAGFSTGGAILIMGAFQTTYPDFTAFVYGEKWALCKR